MLIGVTAAQKQGRRENHAEQDMTQENGNQAADLHSNLAFDAVHAAFRYAYTGC